MTLRLHPREAPATEARLLPACASRYPTITSGWHPILMTEPDAGVVWLPTTTERPVPVWTREVETR